MLYKSVLKKTLYCSAVSITMLAAPAFAASGGDAVPPNLDWPFEGPFGTYDKASLQRGYQVYKNVCASCHGMERIAFRNLEDIGLSELEAKALAA